jgi:hypothetical protein
MKNDDLLYGGCGTQIMLYSIVLFIIAVCFCGCKSVQYVPVEASHTEHHWHTDSIIQKDSVVKESMTTVMQLDSAQMAKYGIQLKNAERAWLVKSWELERQIEQLQKMSAIRDTVRDTIQVPYPVEKKLSKWQQTKVDWGGWAMLGVLVVIILFLFIIPRWKGKRGV